MITCRLLRDLFNLYFRSIIVSVLLMVEKIDAFGHSVSEVLDVLKLRPDSGFRLIYFGPSETVTVQEQRYLSDLSAMPYYYHRSYLLTGMIDSRGRPVRLLAVPGDCPYLGEDEDLPGEEVTYVAKVTRQRVRKRSSPITLLILADDREKAMGVAEKKALRILGRNYQYAIDLRHVSPQEFAKEANRLIDRGHKLPDSILRYRKIGDYALQRELRLA